MDRFRKGRALSTLKKLQQALRMQSAADVQLAVKLRNVSLTFETEPVLDGLNLSVPKSELYCVMGASGCGKTTLLKCIVGQIRRAPHVGVIEIFGSPPGSAKTQVPGVGVGFMPQEIALYDNLTIGDTVAYFCRVTATTEDIRERLGELMAVLDLPGPAVEVSQLSETQRSFLSFAVAVIHQPPLVILDEPTNGMDRLSRNQLWRYLNMLTKYRKMTIIVATHYAEEAMKAHWVGLMREGRVLVEGDPAKIVSNLHAPSLETAFSAICDLEIAEMGRQPRKPSVHFVSGASLFLADEEVKERRNCRGMKGNCKERRNCRGILTRIHALFCEQLTLLRRQKAQTLLQLLFPVLFAYFFSSYIGTDLLEIPLGICHQNASKVSSLIVNNLSNDTFHKAFYQNTSGLQDLKNGKIHGLIHLVNTESNETTEESSEPVLWAQPPVLIPKITLYLDTTKYVISQLIRRELIATIRKIKSDYGFDLFGNKAALVPAFNVEASVFSKINWIQLTSIPCNLVFAIFCIQSTLTFSSLVTDRKNGFLARTLLYNVHMLEILLASFLSQLIIIILQVVISVLALRFVFDFPLDIALKNYKTLGFTALQLFQSGCLGTTVGLFVFGITSGETSGQLCLYFANSVAIFGAFFPPENFAKLIQQISLGIPLLATSQSLQTIIFRHWSPLDFNIWFGSALSFGTTLALLIVSLGLFKQKMKYI